MGKGFMWFRRHTLQWVIRVDRYRYHMEFALRLRNLLNDAGEGMSGWAHQCVVDLIRYYESDRSGQCNVFQVGSGQCVLRPHHQSKHKFPTRYRGSFSL